MSKEGLRYKDLGYSLYKAVCESPNDAAAWVCFNQQANEFIS